MGVFCSESPQRTAVFWWFTISPGLRSEQHATKVTTLPDWVKTNTHFKHAKCVSRTTKTPRWVCFFPTTHTYINTYTQQNWLHLRVASCGEAKRLITVSWPKWCILCKHLFYGSTWQIHTYTSAFYSLFQLYGQFGFAPTSYIHPKTLRHACSNIVHLKKKKSSLSSVDIHGNL